MSETPEYARRINAALALRDIPDHFAALSQLQIAAQQAPQEPSIQILMGLTYQDLHKDKEAITCFRAAITLAPSSREARQSLGLALVQLKEMEEAVQVLEPLVETESGNLPVVKAYAIALKSVGNLYEAERLLQPFFDLEPGNLQVAFDLAELLAQDEDYEGAAQVIEKALDVYSGKSEPEKEYADSFFENMWAELVNYQAISRNFQAAVRATNTGFQKFPQSDPITIAKSNLFLYQGKINEFQEVLSNLIIEKEKSGEKDTLILDAFFQVYGLLKNNSFTLSFTCCEFWQDQFPENENLKSVFSQFRILIFMGQGDYKKALLELNKNYSKKKLKENSNYFIALYGAERPSKALTFTNNCFKDSPDATIKMMERSGWYFYKKGNIHLANLIFEYMLGIAPENAAAFYGLAFLSIGKGDLFHADEYLQKAEEMDYDQFDLVQLCYADLSLRQKAYQVVIDALEGYDGYPQLWKKMPARVAYWWKDQFSNEAIDLFPTREIPIGIAISAEKAIAYLLSNQIDEAVREALAAQELDPRDCVSYRVLACIYKVQGKDDLAIQALKQALLAKKTSEGEVAVIRKWLEELGASKDNDLSTTD